MRLEPRPAFIVMRQWIPAGALHMLSACSVKTGVVPSPSGRRVSVALAFAFGVSRGATHGRVFPDRPILSLNLRHGDVVVGAEQSAVVADLNGPDAPPEEPPPEEPLSALRRASRHRRQRTWRRHRPSSRRP